VKKVLKAQGKKRYKRRGTRREEEGDGGKLKFTTFWNPEASAHKLDEAERAPGGTGGRGQNGTCGKSTMQHEKNERVRA